MSCEVIVSTKVNYYYRTEWQRKVIEAEREKRDFLERIEQESQSGRQSAKKLEKVKRDLEKQAADSAQGWSHLGFNISYDMTIILSAPFPGKNQCYQFVIQHVHKYLEKKSKKCQITSKQN